MISGVVYLDLKKAFDTVDHSLLLTKLEHVGVRGHSLEWFNSYLTNRYQFVYINGVLSEQDMIKCGVPQGSILGPLLFLIYINDLSNTTDFATTTMYADDTNMTFTACSVEGLRHEMSADIEKLKQWLCANKLTMNILKTEYMLIPPLQHKSRQGLPFGQERSLFIVYNPKKRTQSTNKLLCHQTHQKANCVGHR